MEKLEIPNKYNVRVVLRLRTNLHSEMPSKASNYQLMLRKEE